MKSLKLRTLGLAVTLIFITTTHTKDINTPNKELNPEPTSKTPRKMSIPQAELPENQKQNLESGIDQENSEELKISHEEHQKMFETLEKSAMGKPQYLEGNFFGMPVYTDDLAYLPEELRKKFDEQNKGFVRKLVKDVKVDTGTNQDVVIIKLDHILSYFFLLK